jgi:hypothetical protein
MPKQLEPGNSSSDAESVRFEHGLPARLLGIDGTWRRECIVTDMSDDGACVTILSSIAALHVSEFFLSFSSIGLAFHRCELAWVNDDQLGVTFLRHGQRPRAD